jgi:hypothetical protein
MASAPISIILRLSVSRSSKTSSSFSAPAVIRRKNASPCLIKAVAYVQIQRPDSDRLGGRRASFEATAEMRRQRTSRELRNIVSLRAKELVKMINMSDLYVHTSEVEIEAISCLEALSCGIVPVINDSSKSATRTFALSEKNLFQAERPQGFSGQNRLLVRASRGEESLRESLRKVLRPVQFR